MGRAASGGLVLVLVALVVVLAGTVLVLVVLVVVLVLVLVVVLVVVLVLVLVLVVVLELVVVLAPVVVLVLGATVRPGTATRSDEHAAATRPRTARAPTAIMDRRGTARPTPLTEPDDNRVGIGRSGGPDSI